MENEENEQALLKTAFNTFEFGLRLFSGVFVFIYGIAKPWQFAHYADFDVAIDDLTVQLGGFSLMWYFFAYSGTLPIIVGLFECTGAILLLFSRTKLIGAAILLPVLSTVVLFDFVFEVQAFATANAIAYFSVCLFVIFVERTRFLSAIQALLVGDEPKETCNRFFSRQTLLLFAFLTFNWMAINVAHWLARLS